MPFKDFVDSDQLLQLRAVFNQFCAKQQIEDEARRSEVAEAIMSMVRSGVTQPEILADELRKRFGSSGVGNRSGRRSLTPSH